jgi:hypothetical protein
MTGILTSPSEIIYKDRTSPSPESGTQNSRNRILSIWDPFLFHFVTSTNDPAGSKIIVPSLRVSEFPYGSLHKVPCINNISLCVLRLLPRLTRRRCLSAVVEKIQNIMAARS